MVTRMTIHRALSELKLIDAKIEKTITEINPVGIFQKGKLINGVYKPEDWLAQSKLDSANDLIDRKNKIKSAIVAANGVTKVTIAEKEMTIADAINFKASIKMKKQLIDILKGRFKSTVADLYKYNESVNSNMQKILEATFGKENVKVSDADMDAVRKPYLEAYEFHLFDPINCEKTIESLEKEVSEFEVEVDAVLSEINAITFIEI